MTLVVNTLRALFEGYGQRIAEQADPTLNIAWQASGKYDTGEVGIYPGPFLPTDRDEIIVLSPRQLTAHPTLADSTYAMQARFRGNRDPRSTWGFVSAVRAVILGVFPVELPTGLVISTATFAGGTPLPFDDHTPPRAQWTDNYTFQLGEYRAQPF